MTEIHPDGHQDYEAMCALLGPLDFPTFCDGYLAYERWKSWTPRAQQPEVELAMAS